MASLYVLLVALSPLLLLAAGAPSDLRNLPCPDPEDIQPCVCDVDLDYNMHMFCSLVTGEDQLAQIFSSNFPFTNFHTLQIVDNNYLKSLRKGDLGLASFQIIRILNGVLEVVEEEALASSYSTAAIIDFELNQLSTFPFHELPLFTKLDMFHINDNSISFLPPLQSKTLQVINPSFNLLTEVLADTFTGLPSITSIYFIQTGISTFEPGTFAGLQYLQNFAFDFNNLTHLPAGLVELSGADGGTVSLSSNRISSIDVGAITGLKAGGLQLSYNSLRTLPEEVYRPFFEGGSQVFLRGNPLQCGCDMAWLVTNEAFMALLEEGAECFDGELVADLDPVMFDQLCNML